MAMTLGFQPKEESSILSVPTGGRCVVSHMLKEVDTCPGQEWGAYPKVRNNIASVILELYGTG